jgi:TonB family protein
VVLELDIDRQGKVVKAIPVRGPEMFYKEAINAAMQWRYKPATVGGTSVSSQVEVTFDFKLKR